MALPEKNEVTEDIETQPTVNEEEESDSKQEQEENADGVEDADREMNCEDDDDGEALDLDINEEDELEKPKGKKCIPGIVYLGHIPPRMRPKHMRTMLSVYGEIGRIFLQPEGNTTVLNVILNMSITVWLVNTHVYGLTLPHLLQ